MIKAEWTNKDSLDLQPTCNQLATTEGDLISREDAIEAIQNAYCKPCKERGDDHNEVRCRACEYDNAIIQIDALPSAEATCATCADRAMCIMSDDGNWKACKGYRPIVAEDLSDAYKRGFEDAKRAYEVELARSAEAVQGEWIKWFDRGWKIKCSVCGYRPKEVWDGHDYTVPLSDVCPNCRARMKGAEHEND